MLKNPIFELIHSEFCYPRWQFFLFSSVASDISMENGEGNNDEEQLQEALRMSMLPCVKTEREAEAGGAGWATSDCPSSAQLKEPKYVASDQDIFTAAETRASTLHMADTPKMHHMNLLILRDIFASITFQSVPMGLSLHSSTPNPAANQTDLLQDEASRIEIVQAFQQLEVAGNIIPSKQGTNKLQTHHNLHDHLRARSVKLAQNKRACTSTKIWVHDSDDSMQ